MKDKINRRLRCLFYILYFIFSVAPLASCSSDDPLESSAPDGELAEFDEDGDQEQNQEKEQEQETVQQSERQVLYES